MNAVRRAVAFLRARPLLAVAGAGVGAVLVIANRQSDADLAQQPVQEGAAGGMPPISGGLQGYALPGTYAPGDLATADLANAIREGNALNVNQLAQLGNALAPNPAAQQSAMSGAIQPLLEAVKGLADKLPGAGAGPASPPATPVAVPAAPAPTRLSDAQALAIIRSMGAPDAWLTPVKNLGYPLANEGELRGYITRALGNPANRAPTGAPSTGPRTITYTVRSGDSLSAIAGRYGTPGGWQALYAANRAVVGANPNLIRPGMRLSVPATRGY